MYVVTASAYIVLFAQNVMNVSATVSSSEHAADNLQRGARILRGNVYRKSRKNYRTAYMIMGLGGTIPLLVWAFFLKPDSSVLVIYGMTLLGGVAYATR